MRLRTGRRSRAWLPAAVAFGVLAAPGLPAAAAAGDVTEVCRFDDPRLSEISGLAASGLHPNVLWLHNDSSGGPVIFAVDAATCRILAEVTVRGIEARDLEAIAPGRDAKGRAVLWLGDIGDNLDSWPEVRVHRIREPKVLRSRAVSSRTYRFTYEDRPHNAETLLADPGSTRLWVVTKQLARGSLYELPQRMSRTEVNIATRVQREGGLVTDGAVSPQGDRYVLRDYVNAVVYSGLPPGVEQETFLLPLQPQGEAITWTSDGQALLVASERDSRLLRIDLPTAVPTVPSASAGSGEPAPASSDPSGQDPAGDGGTAAEVPSDSSLPTLLLAGALVGGAVLLITVVELRRRRRPAAG